MTTGHNNDHAALRHQEPVRRCGASASIPQQGMLTDYGLLGGVVPDGIATVTARYAPTKTRPGRG